MQAITLDLNQSRYGLSYETGARIAFSLGPFIDYVIKKTQTEATGKVAFYRYMLDKFKERPELRKPIEAEDAGKYTDLFELIYTASSPLLSDEKGQLWAISRPVSPCFYFGTNNFYDLLLDQQTGKIREGMKLPDADDMKISIMTTFYNLVLAKFYDLTFTSGQFTIKSIQDPETKLLKYYRLDVDTRFLDIQFEGELPDLKLENLKNRILEDSNSLNILQELLPPQKFSIEGMSIVHLTDVTGEYALESIKNIIIEHNECQVGAHGDGISTALKTLVGCDQIQFGLLPYIQLNGKVVMNRASGFDSIIATLSNEDEDNRIIYQNLVDDYLKNPRMLIFPEITEGELLNYPILKLLHDHGIRSYALFPLNYNGRIVGCLEVYARDAEIFKSSTLSLLEGALPLLSQLLQNLIVDFNHEVSSIITDKFTSLQPSVQWRFQEAAFNYLLSGGCERSLPIEPIYFEKVQPLYAAVDIKDSSIKRNKAIREDLYISFEVLETLLLAIKKHSHLELTEGIPNQEAIWNYSEFDELSDREVLKIEDYLMRQLPLYLEQLRNTHPELSGVVNDYFEATRNKDSMYKNRVLYEKSMQKINRVVTTKLEEFNAEIQSIYPCYFEKFRTDGVEYDIYVGQSITPAIPMPEDLLFTFRFKQLENMANIAKATHALTPKLDIYMQTTHLIFVYEKLIDISFRTDEQRFDVEGSYNIRYQMVKKRIDKAHIKHSTERVTQPGKIAIIYFNSWEAQEYLGYIKKLQQQQVLEEHIEYIEIEELQGVEGLKALRVGVIV
jgi:hypothetical protein